MPTKKRTLRKTKKTRRGKKTGGSWWNPFESEKPGEQIAKLEEQIARLQAKITAIRNQPNTANPNNAPQPNVPITTQSAQQAPPTGIK